MNHLQVHERPCAAPGLTSYRCRGSFGWIMIGARNEEEAFQEALRSGNAKRETLEVWDGTRYVSCAAAACEVA